MSGVMVPWPASSMVVLLVVADPPEGVREAINVVGLEV